ncbi:mechanosensitive ion channel family protein [Cupriavidus taiwanensis]|uniref:mechanosensitive ion channel family protein n=1 Tax=Cupriavidus taiwanensis TaxID=164546 RepID=UPI0039C010FF
MDLNFIDADQLEAGWSYLVRFGINQGMNCLAAILILMIGWWLSGRVGTAARAALARTHVDATMRPLLANGLQWMVRVLTIVLVLSQFGVQTASIIAMLGAAGLAIGLALQGTLQNIAAGIMLVLLRPFRVGQYIDAQGVAGTVRETGLFMTELTTFDGVCLRVPNGKLWGSAITNYSENATRRADIEATVTFDSDVQRSLEALRAMLAREPRLLAEPAPETMVVNYTQQGITLNVRYWTSNDDYWNVRFAFYERIKQVLEQAGSKLAVPIQELHVPGASSVPGVVKVADSAPSAASRPAAPQSHQPSHQPTRQPARQPG